MQHSIPQKIQQSRLQHTAIVGQPGTAKADALTELIQSDIEADHGLIQFDLDGDATERLLAATPRGRQKDVILIDFSDTEFSPAINPLSGHGSEYDSVIADNLVDAVKAISGYEGMATPDMDRTVYNAARAVIDTPGGTILDMYKMLVDEDARDVIAANAKDPVIANYWQGEFAALQTRDQAFITKSTINKLEPFIADARIRNALGQKRPLIDFRAAIESRKIIAIKIPQSIFGQTKSRLLAGMVLAQFLSIAQRRRGLLRFHVYLPQCHLLPIATVQQMLSTLGSRNVSITLSFEYLHELGALRDAIMGSVANWLIFRMGLSDAAILEEMFPWDNTTNKVHELNPSELHIVMPFQKPIKSVTVISNLNKRKNNDYIVKRSRHFYCRPRSEVEPAVMAKLGGNNEN